MQHRRVNCLCCEKTAEKLNWNVKSPKENRDLNNKTTQKIKIKTFNQSIINESGNQVKRLKRPEKLI